MHLPARRRLQNVCWPNIRCLTSMHKCLLACRQKLIQQDCNVGEYLTGSVHAIAWQEAYIAGQGPQHDHLQQSSMLIRHSMRHNLSALMDQAYCSLVDCRRVQASQLSTASLQVAVRCRWLKMELPSFQQCCRREGVCL